MKAVLQYRASPGFRRQIDALLPDWLQIAVINEADKEAFATAMRDAAILLHVLEPVTADVIADAPNLRLIQKIGVGVNTIDLEAAKRHDVAVCNMPGLRRVPYYDARMRAGDGWTADLGSFDGLGEIAGRTVGLVGYGDVARILSPILTAMGARVLYTATTPKHDADAEWRDLPALMQESDIVSLHLPLTAETEGMIDAAALASMKQGAVLINTARGGLVDEPALVEALSSGRLRAAGLDVVCVEPAPAGNPLFALDNVVVMPHIAWITAETLERSLGIAFENCRRVRDGEDLLHRVV
jgi:phosphoglycerate dehydrogenase-like enzyme